MPDDQTAALLSELLLLDEDELYYRLGSEVAGKHAGPPNAEFLVAAGKAWIASNGAHLESLLCSDARLRRLAGSDPGAVDRLMIAGVVSDLFGSGGFATAAVIITRAGIHNLCGKRWSLPRNDDDSC